MTNRPKAAAYRAPGAPMGAYAIESVIDELCRELKLDPIEVPLKNASSDGSKASYGPNFGVIGLKAQEKGLELLYDLDRDGDIIEIRFNV